MDIAIIGAGIGGLSAAIALARDGHRVILFEGTAHHITSGAGITLGPNAVHILADLGVSLTSESCALTAVELRNNRGRLLATVPQQQLAMRYGPTYGIARAKLHELLIQALPDAVEVRLGQRIDSVTPVGHQLRLSSSQLELDVEVAVAADGLHSTIRAALPDGPGRLRSSGTICWRGLMDFHAGSTATEAWGGSTRVGMVPISERQAYYYLVAKLAPGWVEPANHSELSNLFQGYSGVAGRLLRELPAFPPLRHELFELDRPVWGNGKVLLLGDAAHGMTPNQGQGAAMAVEDAKALTLALRSGSVDALARYRHARASRVRAVQLSSRRLGQMAHWTHPVAQNLRTAAMLATPTWAMERRLAALVRPGIDLATIR